MVVPHPQGWLLPLTDPSAVPLRSRSLPFPFQPLPCPLEGTTRAQLPLCFSATLACCLSGLAWDLVRRSMQSVQWQPSRPAPVSPAFLTRPHGPWGGAVIVTPVRGSVESQAVPLVLPGLSQPPVVSTGPAPSCLSAQEVSEGPRPGVAGSHPEPAWPMRPRRSLRGVYPH